MFASTLTEMGEGLAWRPSQHQVLPVSWLLQQKQILHLCRFPMPQLLMVETCWSLPHPQGAALQLEGLKTDELI